MQGRRIISWSARIVLAATAIVVAGCIDRSHSGDRVEPEEFVPGPVARPAAPPLREELLSHIDSLVSAGGHGSRVVFTAGNRWSVEYIERAMRRSGGEPERQRFSVLRTGGRRDELANVLARVKGVSDSVLVLCAHLDASASRDPGWHRNWSTMPAPGADDDATGVAVLLCLLDSVVRSKVPPHYTLLIAAVNAEERNPDYAGLSHQDGHHLGSRHLAGALSRSGVPLRGVIAMDMVGWNPNGDYLPLFASSRGIGLAREIAATNERFNIGLIIPRSFAPCPNSDNESFERFGVPSVLLMESCRPWRRDGNHPSNPGYHTSRDVSRWVTPSIVEKVTRLMLAVTLNRPAPPSVE